MLISLALTIGIGLISWLGASFGFNWLFAVALPLAAFFVFIIGLSYKIYYWASSPVPFAIPTTAGQGKSLSWIKPARLETPVTIPGVIGRMALEIFCFRSLFRNTQAIVDEKEPRIIYYSSKWLWAVALIFHYAFLLIFIRHFRFFIESVPACITIMENLDGIMQVGIPRLYQSDMLITMALLFLIGRRFVLPRVKQISLPVDYLILFVILGLVSSGIIMRYFLKIDVASAKIFILSLVRFSPQSFELAASLSPLFILHLTFLSILLILIPFSKITHMLGVFLSPTRNMLCNTRAYRHINPWGVPAKFHTYEAYENDFREAMDEAGLPLEKALVNNESTP